MCGRYAVITNPEALRALFRYFEQPNFPPRYNVAPTQPVPIVRVVEGKREFALVRWGLIPPWVKDPRVFSLLINARGESVNEKPAFKNAMKRRRCLFPADGFYEWKAGPKPSGGGRPVKQPYFIHRLDGEPLAFAGLWETWKVPEDADPELGGDDGWLRSCAIVTGPPNEIMVPIHNRMPVVLPESAWEQWLDPDNHDVEALTQLLVPAPAEWFEAYAVSTSVNNARTNNAELVRAIDS